MNNGTGKNLMVTSKNERKRHFILEGVTRTETYRHPGAGGSQSKIPERDRSSHGAMLRKQIQDVQKESDSARHAQQSAGMEDGFGLQVEFKSFPDIPLAFESLARERVGIELLNVRHKDQTTMATVFVPDGKLVHFEGLIRDYLEEKKDKIGRRRDHRRLIDSIQQIRSASLRALWTDADDAFPGTEETPLWWEVWLFSPQDYGAVTTKFRELARSMDMQVTHGNLIFPERAVLLVQASVLQMKESITILNRIAELRQAKKTAEFFDSLKPKEQDEWLAKLLPRIRFSDRADQVPHVCLLDTGVNRGHPLLRHALADEDCHSVDPNWGIHDDHGHGTEMAGIALAGNLTELFSGDEAMKIDIDHRLESMKLLPKNNTTGTPQHHGWLTKEAIARLESTTPTRLRVFGMAVTAPDNRDRGQPSAWSAALDSLAADVDGGGVDPRLLVVSAGNIEDSNAWSNYPNSNDTDGVHDPAQAWNALTVGACTHLERITETNTSAHRPVAPSGGLSPFSTTSLTWSPKWPLKPDVVLEGGNVAQDSLSAVQIPSLSLLTTFHHTTERLFTTTTATSAATALASRLAAQIQSVYSDLWPETIRALIVHSAEWSETMKGMSASGNTSKKDYKDLLRRCGFGIPDLDRALWSVSNSLTMVAQESLHPFRREPQKQPALRDMHLHSLPWPADVLESLGPTRIQMRITLSYFIEPNPSQRGARSRYHYQSHGLRFEVKRPHESVEDFRKRINKAARGDGEESPGGTADRHWLIGPQTRHTGSLHGDIWKGSAADLAGLGSIAVYPVSGWWKTRATLKKYNEKTRYALLISIKAPKVDVDLYAEIANRIAMQTKVAT